MRRQHASFELLVCGGGGGTTLRRRRTGGGARLRYECVNAAANGMFMLLGCGFETVRKWIVWSGFIRVDVTGHKY